MDHDAERRRKLQEATQRMLERGMLSPEQIQMAQQALQQMQQSGAAHFSYTVIKRPEGTVIQQSGQPVNHLPGYPHSDPGMQPPPATGLPNQPPFPSAIPQGYVDPLYRNAIAELQRWLAQYEKYRMQGSFAQIEPIFQAIKQITER